MALTLVITDGPNIWDSDSIRPSSSRPASTSSGPAYTNPTSTSVCVDPTNPSANVNCVEVYVAVTNQGGPDVGCPVGDWKDPLASPLQFTGFSPQNGTPSDTNFGWTFNGSAAQDTL